MRLREVLKRFRLRPSQVDGERADNVDALASDAAASARRGGPDVVVAPTNWVPSQQDEGPRY